MKLVENTEETVHAKKLLDELRSEVREALSGMTALNRPLPEWQSGSICPWDRGLI